MIFCVQISFDLRLIEAKTGHYVLVSTNSSMHVRHGDRSRDLGSASRRFASDARRLEGLAAWHGGSALY